MQGDGNIGSSKYRFGNKNIGSDYFIDDLSFKLRIDLEVSECLET